RWTRSTGISPRSTCERGRTSAAASPSARSEPPDAPPARTCITRCACTARLSIRTVTSLTSGTPFNRHPARGAVCRALPRSPCDERNDNFAEPRLTGRADQPTDSSHPSHRFPMVSLPGHGSILLVDALLPELARIADVLGSLGETRVVSPADGLTALARFGADVIVARDGVDLSGAHFLRQAAVLHPSAVRILIADDGGAQLRDTDAVIRRPVNLAALRAICAIALRGAAAERAVRAEREENERLREVGNQVPCELVEDAEGLACYEGIITRSPRMRRVLHLLGTIEATDTTVLIHGETGTGKELAAQAIHRRSRRPRARFVAVNLGSISDPLRESELFGHVRGAFTGALESRGGLFAEADGGTLFLDEVGDASPGLQVALLRVLEEGTITPVGADRTRRGRLRILSP